MKWFQERWAGSLRHKQERKTNANPAWEWCIVSQQAYVFLDDIRPWLRLKGPQADNALLCRELRLCRGSGTSMSTEEVAQRVEIKRQANLLNKRGALGQDAYDLGDWVPAEGGD
jgi:hypothetical protein